MIARGLKDEVYKCIKCGQCLTACPVYKQLFTEAAAPRGKVQLIKHIVEGRLEPSENFSRILYTCLLCEACTVNCPSGLKVDRLLKAMRAEMVKKFRLPWQKRVLFHMLSGNRLLPFLMQWGGSLGNTLMGLVPGGKKIGTIPFDKLPRLNRKPFREQVPEVIKVPEPKGRVLYFTGCATNYLYEDVGRSTLDVLKRLGIEVILPQEQMCCGLPIFLAGARNTALTNIRKNLELFDRKDVDTVLVDCATCGSALKKEYVHILEEMGENVESAKSLSKKVMDLSQYLVKFDLDGILKPMQGKVTYHDPCHLVRSQGVREEPRRLLRQIPGLQLIEMAGADVCCGGGGTFQIDHPDVAAGITGDKVRAIKSTGANIVASGCPGCRMQIKGNLEKEAFEVVHPVQLLARALK